MPPRTESGIRRSHISIRDWHQIGTDGKRKINPSQVFAGQNVDLKEASDKIWHERDAVAA